jgi:hypothetical protein
MQICFVDYVCARAFSIHSSVQCHVRLLFIIQRVSIGIFDSSLHPRPLASKICEPCFAGKSKRSIPTNSRKHSSSPLYQEHLTLVCRLQWLLSLDISENIAHPATSRCRLQRAPCSLCFADPLVQALVPSAAHAASQLCVHALQLAADAEQLKMDVRGLAAQQ